MSSEQDNGIEATRDNAVGWIRINRPERLNAFAGEMRTHLAEALDRFEADPEVRCVVITGVGRAFSTGGDIAVMTELVTTGDRDTFEQLVRAGMRVVRTIDEMSKPVIAAVNGPAAGAGACLALACDIRIASEAASIGFTFVRVGLHPDWGGSYFLPRIIGRALTAELFFTGGMLSAERAERAGIFNRVVPADELESAARALANQISHGPAGLLADEKRTLRHRLNATLPEVLDWELEAQLRAFDSPDAREGFTAFTEKRAPRFAKR